MKHDELLKFNATGRAATSGSLVQTCQKDQTTRLLIFVDCQQHDGSSLVASSLGVFNTALSKTIARRCRRRNESTLTPDFRRISNFRRQIPIRVKWQIVKCLSAIRLEFPARVSVLPVANGTAGTRFSRVLRLSRKRARVAALIQTMTESRIKYTRCGKMSVPSECPLSSGRLEVGHQPTSELTSLPTTVLR